MRKAHEAGSRLKSGFFNGIENKNKRAEHDHIQGKARRS